MNMSNTNNDIILSVRDLKTHFPLRGGLWGKRKFVRAVDGVSFDIRQGKTLGLVGESGSGKTTVGRSLLRLIHANAGEVIFEGRDVLQLPPGQLRNLRRKMQIIFQDPFGSLNPRMTVGDIVGEPLIVHRLVPRRERSKRVAHLLERVGLPGIYARRYPHEFSGGQRQRIGIARALASEAEFLICDEPVSALDVSIQAQILNLLKDLQEELGLTYLFIAHNLAVVEHFCDEVAVMYLGRIVEKGPRESIYSNPRHPYTQALLASAPSCECACEESRRRLSSPLTGEVPSPIDPPAGCSFHTRCPLTRKLAAERPHEDRHVISCDDNDVEIVDSCRSIEPRLEPTSATAGHVHSCTLRMGM